MLFINFKQNLFVPIYPPKFLSLLLHNSAINTLCYLGEEILVSEVLKM